VFAELVSVIEFTLFATALFQRCHSPHVAAAGVSCKENLKFWQTSSSIATKKSVIRSRRETHLSSGLQISYELKSNSLANIRAASEQTLFGTKYHWPSIAIEMIIPWRECWCLSNTVGFGPGLEQGLMDHWDALLEIKRLIDKIQHVLTTSRTNKP